MNASELSTVQQWLARQACRDCILRAGAALDAGDYGAFVRRFLPSATLIRPGQAALVGREAILASYRSRPKTRHTRHLVTNIVVELRSENLAEASSSVLLWSATVADVADDGTDAAARPGNGYRADNRQLLGEFKDVLMKTGEDWLISQRNACFVMFRDDPA
jgi:hypothetical protein